MSEMISVECEVGKQSLRLIPQRCYLLETFSQRAYILLKENVSKTRTLQDGIGPGLTAELVGIENG
jgi:hypothetical protein